MADELGVWGSEISGFVRERIIVFIFRHALMSSGYWVFRSSCIEVASYHIRLSLIPMFHFVSYPMMISNINVYFVSYDLNISDLSKFADAFFFGFSREWHEEALQ